MEPDQMCAIGGCPGEATGPVVFRDGTQQFVCSEHHHEIQRVIGFAVFASDRVHGEWFTESDAMKEYLCASQSSPLD